jgi:hypothetical protein
VVKFVNDRINWQQVSLVNCRDAAGNSMMIR